MSNPSKPNDAIAIDATDIIDKLLAGQVELQRECREIRAQVATLTRLVDSHQIELQLQRTKGSVQ